MSTISGLKKAFIEKDFERASTFLSSAEPDKEGLQSLAAVFMFVSLLFRYPDEKVYGAVKTHLGNFKDFIDEYSENGLALEDNREMEHDYVRLFVNAKGGMRANPYASCYFGEEKLLWGAEMVRLKELMASEGFKMGEGVAELEDHVGIVMEFCSALLEKIAGCRDDQCGIGSCFAFLEISKDFFPVFAGEFADKVVLGAELEYYKNAALLLKSFLYEAEELFEELLFDSAS